MPSTSHAIRFDKIDLEMIEKFRAGRRLSFGGAVKELMWIGNSSFHDKNMGESFKDFVQFSKRVQSESLLLLRYYIHHENNDLYTRVQQEAKNILANINSDT